MITAETVNAIVRFQANGLPVVSLYCRVDPGASQREVRARVDSLLDQIRPLAKDRALDHRYRLSVRMDIERIKDALGSERWPRERSPSSPAPAVTCTRRYRCRAGCGSRSWWTRPAARPCWRCSASTAARASGPRPKARVWNVPGRMREVTVTIRCKAGKRKRPNRIQNR